MHARSSDRFCSLPAVLALVAALTTSAHAGPPPSAPPAPEARRPAAQPITEADLRRQLQGKSFYLRGGYLDNTLHFDQNGRLAGSAPQVSYTLSMVEINKVSLSKHKVQLEGIRYAIHFLEGGPAEDVAGSDKVRITPKKKVLRITIDRAEVVPQKKTRNSKSEKGPQLAPRQSPAPSPGIGDPASAAGFENPTAWTQAHANQLLNQALDRVFTQGLDEKMVASLPDYWRLYYQASASRSSYKPSDPSVLRQSAVDQKARLLNLFEPPSNDYAQAAGVAGVALYHVVVGRDGKAGEIAVGRPIGFGLDENAVASIRKASFQPAVKDGHPVPVVLDLLVQFRIYSNRTKEFPNLEASSATVSEPEAPPLPGPYTANQPQTKPQ